MLVTAAPHWGRSLHTHKILHVLAILALSLQNEKHGLTDKNIYKIKMYNFPWLRSSLLPSPPKYKNLWTLSNCKHG